MPVDPSRQCGATPFSECQHQAPQERAIVVDIVATCDREIRRFSLLTSIERLDEDAHKRRRSGGVREVIGYGRVTKSSWREASYP